MVVGTSLMSSPRLVAARTPPQRGFAATDPGGGREGGDDLETTAPPAGEAGESGSLGAVEGALPPGLAQLLAVARHGDLATLPPSQRHLVARLLLHYGSNLGRSESSTQHQQLLRRQQQCMLLQMQRQVRKAKDAKKRDEEKPVFKEPLAPAAPRLRNRVPKENAAGGATFVDCKRRRQTSEGDEGREADRQWIPVSRGLLDRVRGDAADGDEWRPVKVGRLCLRSPSPPQQEGESTPMSMSPAPQSPNGEAPASPCVPRIPCSACYERTSPRPDGEAAEPCENRHVPGTTCMMCGVTSHANANGGAPPVGHAACHLHLRYKEIARRLRRRRRVQRGPASYPGTAIPAPSGDCSRACCPAGHRFSWLNQLTRIFLQETPEDAKGKEAEAAEGDAGAPTPATPAANTQGDGSSACSSSSSSGSGIDSSSSNSSSNNKVSSLSTPQGSSVVTTLAGSGMGNPFARAASQTTWESPDQKPILAPPRLAPPSEAGTPKVSSSGMSVIRPSALGSSRPGGSSQPGSSLFTPPTLTVTSSSPPQASKSAFKLKPSVLSGSTNPFAKAPSEPEDKADSTTGLGEGGSSEEPASSLSSSQEVSLSTSGATSRTSQEKQSEEGDTPMEDKPCPANSASNTSTSTSDSSSSNTGASNTNSSRSLFVPLARNGEGSDSSLSPSITRNSFIFGQNLQSKVVAGDAPAPYSADSAATTNGENQAVNLFSAAASEITRESAATNGRMGTGNLFSDAASEISVPREDNLWNSRQSLAESSRELTEKENSQKRKFDQVEVITGEESESNVLQMNCKLYAWVSGSWQERGRGILRLNDWDAGQEIHSRLVIRTQGTLTVMLNTKVWSDMSVERASNKSVRFTALDADGQPKIFLAMGSPKDVDLLYNSLEWRVAASRSQTNDEAQTDSTKKPKKDDAEAESLTS